jgi:hypothetical protein
MGPGSGLGRVCMGKASGGVFQRRGIDIQGLCCFRLEYRPGPNRMDSHLLSETRFLLFPVTSGLGRGYCVGNHKSLASFMLISMVIAKTLNALYVFP